MCCTSDGYVVSSTARAPCEVAKFADGRAKSAVCSVAYISVHALQSVSTTASEKSPTNKYPVGEEECMALRVGLG